MTNYERCQYIRAMRLQLANNNQVEYTIRECDLDCKKMCHILICEGDELELRLRARNDEGYNIDLDSINGVYGDAVLQDKKDPEVRRWKKFAESIRHYEERRLTMGILLDESVIDTDPDIQTFIDEVMNYGKELCKRLKAIRKAVADANGIAYNPKECHHKGSCPGTCPVCDVEVEAINKALKRKVAMGEDIVIPEFDVEDICRSGIDPHPVNPFAGEARTPDEIKAIYEEYDIPYDEDEDEDTEDSVLMGDLISPIDEMVDGNLDIPEILGGKIISIDDDDDDDDDIE